MNKLFFALGFLSLLFFLGCKDELPIHQVTYSVTGTTTRANVKYEWPSMGEQYVHNVLLPWEKTLPMSASGNEITLWAQNLENSGSITVSIFKDGRLLSDSTDTGDQVIVECSGFLYR